jgi:glutathione S-transferase
MILVGQFDSPFVRRVGVALSLYGLDFEHRPWSVWADGERIAELNPLRRVPILVLDSGEVLIESTAILDALDELVGAERALLPRSGPVRRDGLRVAALATGVADKAVSLLYEKVLRPAPERSAVWIGRCEAQIADTLALLARDREARGTRWWLGENPSHADVAVACMLRFLSEAHPELYRSRITPPLERHAASCEALAAFRNISQKLDVAV